MSIFVHKVYYPWHSGPCEHEYDVSRYAIIKNPYQQHIVFLWTKTTKIKCLPTPWTESSDYYLQFGVCIISSFSMNNLMYQALVPWLVWLQSQLWFSEENRATAVWLVPFTALIHTWTVQTTCNANFRGDWSQRSVFVHWFPISSPPHQYLLIVKR